MKETLRGEWGGEGGGGGGGVVTDRFTPLGIELKSHLVKLNHGVNES